ncbi:hypothetical protein HX89_07715 [Dermacoccus nishinomiyaensis]|uniref:Uncharacterized protein n=1 Tax=Dermacoccus nishinomiyaensis TaxID=1274 RepID=A0A075JL93_9MICO|nr:hypothetical protein HX89_07715 [Dermacoccus nishinomiyaensis]
MVTVREGGEALHVHAQDLGERGTLGLAELGVARRDVLHRAVPLAQLYAGERGSLRDGTRRGGKALTGQGACEGVGAGVGVVTGGLDGGTDAVGQLAGAFLRDGDECLLAPELDEVRDDLRGESVVAVGHRAVAGFGEDVGARRATAPARTCRRGLAFGDEAVSEQSVEVTAHGRGREVHPLPQLGRRHGAVLGDGRTDAFAGRGGRCRCVRGHLLRAHVRGRVHGRPPSRERLTPKLTTPMLRNSLGE